MTRPAATARLRSNRNPVSPRLAARPVDIQTALSEALGAGWLVQRETDPGGDMSVLVMAADDADNALPTFMVYERDGLAQVASVQADAWHSLAGFASAHAAVAAIVSAIANLPSI